MNTKSYELGTQSTVALMVMPFFGTKKVNKDDNYVNASGTQSTVIEVISENMEEVEDPLGDELEAICSRSSDRLEEALPMEDTELLEAFWSLEVEEIVHEALGEVKSDLRVCKPKCYEDGRRVDEVVPYFNRLVRYFEYCVGKSVLLQKTFCEMGRISDGIRFEVLNPNFYRKLLCQENFISFKVDDIFYDGDKQEAILCLEAIG